MSKLTQSNLKRSAEIMRKLSCGEEITLTGADLKLVPDYFGLITPTAAKKKGLILKRNATRAAKISYYKCGVGWCDGELFFLSSYKPKPAKSKGVPHGKAV